MSDKTDQIETNFSAAMGALGSDLHATGLSRLGVAVSGGGDSMALLVLLADWARQNGTKVEALSIDHGFRAEARAEIALAADLCGRLGIPHHSVSWRWDGAGNLQDSARAARRAAFANWQREARLDAVALGHTRDDQAETVLLRLARGSGVDGLAAMEARSVRPDLTLIRPLLDVRRADLRAYLMAKGVRWADDPSNDDPRFDRVRARRMLETLAPLGLGVDRLTRTAGQMQSARRVLRAAARQLAESAVVVDRGDLVINRTQLDQAADETAHRVLAGALGFVSGHQYRPRFDRLVAALAAGKRATLHGCLLGFSPSTVRISREPAAVEGLVASPDQVWDGRWRLTGPAQPDAVIRALADNGLRQVPDWRDTGLPRHSLVASPAIWQGETLIAAPVAGFENGWKATLLPEKSNFAAYLPL